MQAKAKYVITVAGFDPSGGAGLLADIKTFEQFGVQGLGVCTAITFQTEDEFKSVSWIPYTELQEQLSILIRRYEVEYLKIGLVESFETLHRLILFARQYKPVQFILDPVLRASAGFQFHSEEEREGFSKCAKYISLITPNAEEIKWLSGKTDVLEACRMIGGIVPVFLKSYRNENGKHCDILFNNGETVFETDELTGAQKHGSGCVLSSAIIASLAKGFDLITSCRIAKEYTREFLGSSESLLGFHHHINPEVQYA